MATKKFKDLPKDAKRAAFAQMDKDGTRENRQGKNAGGIPVKSLGRSKNKLPHIKTEEQQALLNRSVYHYEKGSKTDQSRMEQGLFNGQIKAEQNLRGVYKSSRKFDELQTAKKSVEFLSSARAFSILASKRGSKKGK